jgi:hypothetical protein
MSESRSITSILFATRKRLAAEQASNIVGNEYVKSCARYGLKEEYIEFDILGRLTPAIVPDDILNSI